MQEHNPHTINMEQYTKIRQAIADIQQRDLFINSQGDIETVRASTALAEYVMKLLAPSPAKAEQEGLRWVNFSEFKFNTPDVFTLRRIDDKRSTVSLFIDETTDIADLIRRQFGSITYSVQLEYLSESTTPPVKTDWEAKYKEANQFIIDLAKELGQEGLGYDDLSWTIEDFMEAARTKFEAPVKQVAYDELWDEFSEHVDDDIDSLSMFAGRSVLTETQYNKLVAKLKAPPGYEALQPPFPRSVDDRIIARRNLYMSLEQAVYQKGYDEGKQSAPSGLRLINAAKDLPGHNDPLPVRIDGITWRMGNFYCENFKWFLFVQGLTEWIIPEEKFNGVEWLCESDSPAPVQVDPVAYSEWVDANAVRSGMHSWTIGAGKETTRYTSDQLLEKYTQSLQNKP